jgi:hypothetical protein
MRFPSLLRRSKRRHFAKATSGRHSPTIGGPRIEPRQARSISHPRQMVMVSGSDPDIGSSSSTGALTFRSAVGLSA